ncbi:MAG: hypothetical protein A2504_02270 [Bdellovibrionales bacterium RIFOXYD12_FULL_39_22]|nr:MAG: hypothetical protein A2385_12295 [Bdellovibrionales bacterium RIFOXYB1_FULL_39_21]OFZ41421.1 MAG: hypothetical protein A2485_01465 [Bdellovibrionales bacterium RIFOXYC12_FULL_39_17]OFZ45376.1 MAG: hypothetical protein A2404_13480 [Bdellovibrionales bacterium RIFOXYC1_FULL_39_130]OFZ74572.1 MAG: hypothetical protein A2560_12585 [Bdellovibrionales bacterium RIFOXYD1_FULL_39_84]OFZ74864.1 MAG: hypothetical protein A2451_04630 [Bdellovibrionales bacterium RIFOXYC2_FULL_39_8]OFZ92581.1 MAG:
MIKLIMIFTLLTFYTVSFAQSSPENSGPAVTEEQKDEAELFLSQLVEAVKLADFLIDLEITETATPDPLRKGKYIKKYKIDYFDGSAQFVMNKNIEHILQSSDEKPGSSIVIFSKDVIGATNLRIDDRGVIFVDVSFEKDGKISALPIDFINRQGVAVPLHWRISGLSVAINGAIDKENNVVQVSASCDAEQFIDPHKSIQGGVRPEQTRWASSICKYMMKKDKTTNISETKYRFCSDRNKTKRPE